MLVESGLVERRYKAVCEVLTPDDFVDRAEAESGWPPSSAAA